MTHDNIFLTVDPGRDGAAVIWENNIPATWMFFHHTKRRDYGAMLYEFLQQYGSDRIRVAFLERIFRPYKGTITEGTKLGCLQILRIPTVRLYAQTWQKHRNANTDDGWKNIPWNYSTQNKAKSVHFVTTMMPDLNLLRTEACDKPHDGLADAICIGLWAIDGMEQGVIKIPKLAYTTRIEYVQEVLFDD